jgi:hypothetical protein
MSLEDKLKENSEIAASVIGRYLQGEQIDDRKLNMATLCLKMFDEYNKSQQRTEPPSPVYHDKINECLVKNIIKEFLWDVDNLIKKKVVRLVRLENKDTNTGATVAHGYYDNKVVYLKISQLIKIITEHKFKYISNQSLFNELTRRNISWKPLVMKSRGKSVRVIAINNEEFYSALIINNRLI